MVNTARSLPETHDLTWDEVTEHEDLQAHLEKMLEHGANTPEFLEAAQVVAGWLEGRMAFCEAVVVTGRMYMSNGDPGYPDEYCDSLVAVGKGNFCELHDDE